MPTAKVTRSEKVSRAFKAAQVSKGYTQDSIARRLGVERSTISRWYRNPDNMSVGHLRLLCQVLSLSPADILSIE